MNISQVPRGKMDAETLQCPKRVTWLRWMLMKSTHITKSVEPKMKEKCILVSLSWAPQCFCSKISEGIHISSKLLGLHIASIYYHAQLFYKLPKF